MMKMRNLSFILVLVSGLLFGGCSKSSDDNPASPASKGTLSLKHDGQAWNASLSVQGVNSNGVVNITGSDSNAGQGSIVVYQPTGPGTYKIGPGGNPGNMGRWTQGLEQKDSYVASSVLGSGEVTFTELSATGAKGSFQFTGYNTDQASVVVTEGSFDVKF